MRHNIANWERIGSVAVGALFLTMAARRRRLGSPAAMVGGALVLRGVTGRSLAYAAAGVSSRETGRPARVRGGGARMTTVAMTINRSAQEVLDIWRRFEQSRPGRAVNGSLSVRDLTRGGCEVLMSVEHGRASRLREDLRQLKRLLEAGELPVGARPSGPRTLTFRALKAVMA
jgi:hypothetical protein